MLSIPTAVKPGEVSSRKQTKTSLTSAASTTAAATKPKPTGTKLLHISGILFDVHASKALSLIGQLCIWLMAIYKYLCMKDFTTC